MADVDNLSGHGVVYTRPWVVEMILDMVGYVDGRDLGGMSIVEPSCGEGAFLGEIVRRLVVSCRRYGRDVRDAAGAVVACELAPQSARRARRMVAEVLMSRDVDARGKTLLGRGITS